MRETLTDIALVLAFVAIVGGGLLALVEYVYG